MIAYRLPTGEIAAVRVSEDAKLSVPYGCLLTWPTHDDYLADLEVGGWPQRATEVTLHPDVAAANAALIQRGGIPLDAGEVDPEGTTGRALGLILVILTLVLAALVAIILTR